jgi:hypothetical protein
VRRAINAGGRTARSSSAINAGVPKMVRNRVVGQGVIRATGRLEQMTRVRVVMKMEAYKGKLYYILTAFPEL